MANPVVRIPPINPIRLIPVTTVGSEYNTLPFDLQENEDCYFQKIKKNVPVSLQISALTEVTDLECKLYDLLTGAEVEDYAVIPVDLTIINDEGYTYHEITCSFINVDEGKYYLEITATDPETSNPIAPFQSDILLVAENHPDTLLYEYRNSENDFSVIFDTGIIFRLLVESTIEDYDPQFEDVSYIDEIHNTTKLNSVSYDKFTLYTPNIGGFIVPWIAKKLNLAMGCDSVKIDGVYYERIEGSKWEVQRAPRSKKMGMKIDIVPVENLFQRRIKTGDKNPGNFQIVDRVLPFNNQSTNFSVIGVFTQKSLLEKIQVDNNNLTDYSIKVGTTPNGDDICTIEAKDFDTDVIPNAQVEVLNLPFYGSETLYVSGLTGVSGLSVDVTFVYQQLDAPSVSLPFTAPDLLGKGATMRYEEINPGDLEANFDLGSGLGISGSKWEKWAFKDGRNGGVDESGCVAVMFDPTNPDYANMQLKSGSASGKITLTTGQLPTFSLQYRASQSNGSAAGQIEANHLKSGTDRGFWLSDGLFNTNTIGNGEQIDIRQQYIVALTIIKIAD